MSASPIRTRRAAIAALAGILAAAAGLSNAFGHDTASRAPFGAADLSLRQLAGERLIAGFSGTSPPAKLESMIRNGDIAGVILFDDNLPSARRGSALIRHLQAIRRPRGLGDPLLVMIDQEGGLVKRLPGPPDASAAAMGHKGASFSRSQGGATAAELRRVGVNVNLAPVLDVGRPGSAIRDQHRSFGGSADRVAETAIPFAEALQAGGVAATGKHFPGLGAAVQDTDFAVQRVDLPRRTLRRTDERPYRSLIAAGGDMVMISTAIYPAFSPKPAAFAQNIATGELRDRLGFDGVSISDALGTVSAHAFGGSTKVGVAAARAGTDLLLYTDYRDTASADAALRRGLGAGRLTRSSFEASAQRVLDLRAKLGG